MDRPICTAHQLRQIAGQVEAYTALIAAGANHIFGGTPILVDGVPLAYLWWHEDGQEYLAIFDCGKHS